MEEGWKLIYSTDKPYQAGIVVEMLSDNNIIGLIINKKDSTYLSFGDTEVHVKEEEYNKAIEIIKSSEL